MRGTGGGGGGWAGVSGGGGADGLSFARLAGMNEVESILRLFD